MIFFKSYSSKTKGAFVMLESDLWKKWFFSSKAYDNTIIWHSYDFGYSPIICFKIESPIEDIYSPDFFNSEQHKGVIQSIYKMFM